MLSGFEKKKQNTWIINNHHMIREYIILSCKIFWSSGSYYCTEHILVGNQRWYDIVMKFGLKALYIYCSPAHTARAPQSRIHELMLILSLQCHVLLDCVWLKPGVGHSFIVICSEVLPHTAAVWHCHHIERIRGINAYSLACSMSPWQVCGGV